MAALFQREEVGVQLMVEENQVTKGIASPEGKISAAAVPMAPPRPRSNIFTLLLLLSFMFLLIAIYLVGWELRNFYQATFGILSPIESKEAVYPAEEISPLPEEGSPPPETPPSQPEE